MDNDKKTKNLTNFDFIRGFFTELNQMFGDKYKAIRLYKIVLDRTKIGNIKAIQKNIELMLNFCKNNEEKILSLDYNFTNPHIKYSKAIDINMHTIFSFAEDDETRKTIWKYILTLFVLLDNSIKSRELLKRIKTEEDAKTTETNTDEKDAKDAKDEKDEKNTGTEGNFVRKIMSKVESGISKDASPKEVLNSVIQSGVLTDIFDGMKNDLNDGKMDISKLFGTVQGMLSSLSEETGDDPEAKNAVNMLNTMTGMLNGNSDANPAGMLSMMMGTIGSMGAMGAMGNNDSGGNNDNAGNS